MGGDLEIEEALEEWRWLVPQPVRSLVMTALGDLFLIAEDGSVLFLDTQSGRCDPAAASVDEWEQKLLEDDKKVEHWFMPGFVEQLRDAKPLSQGECYSPLHAPIVGGEYTVENWQPTNWSVHLSYEGRMHEAIKDLPDGTKITEWKYTKL